MHKLNVHLADRSYPIYIESCFKGISKVLEETFEKETLYIVITDSNVYKYYYENFKEALQTEKIECFVIEAGEQSKNIESVKAIYDFLIDKHADRKSVLIALGGGVVGDLTGFVAGTYMRGIRYVQVPTTLLAQVDSSVGGKTGIDYGTLKNIVGVFKQPQFVWINTTTLETLDARQYKAGIAEMIVHSLIGGKEAFSFLQENLNAIKMRHSDKLQEIIAKSCDIKVKIVESDEFETGIRQHLNLGHTVGHAIEGWSNYELLHGEAVAIGLRVIFEFAAQKGYITEAEKEKVKSLLLEIGLPITLENIVADEILEKMKHDKKVKNEKIHFVVPSTLGEVWRYPLEADDEKLIHKILNNL